MANAPSLMVGYENTREIVSPYKYSQNMVIARLVHDIKSSLGRIEPCVFFLEREGISSDGIHKIVSHTKEAIELILSTLNSFDISDDSQQEISPKTFLEDFHAASKNILDNINARIHNLHIVVQEVLHQFPQSEYLNVINKSVLSALQRVNTLKNYTHAEWPISAINRELLLRNLKERIQSWQGSKIVSFTNSLNENEILIDEALFFSLAENILSNAVSFAKSHIAARIWNSDTIIFLEITDDGEGMSKADLGNIGIYGVTKRKGGSGVGIASLLPALQSIGGKFIVATTEQKGTCVRIEFPCKKVAKMKEAA